MVEERLELGEVMTVTEVVKRIKSLNAVKTEIWGSHRYYTAMKNHSEGKAKERFEHLSNTTYKDYDIVNGKLRELYRVLCFITT